MTGRIIPYAAADALPSSTPSHQPEQPSSTQKVRMESTVSIPTRPEALSDKSGQGLGPIARHARSVLWFFRALLDSIHAYKRHDGLGDSSRDLAPFRNEMTRFKMWVGNLGAHQGGGASLDYRLREAPHLRDQVLYLLRDASESLQDALNTIQQLASAPPPQARSQGNIEEEQAEATEMNLDGASESGFSDSDADEPSPERRLLILHADIREIADCLLRLSVAIANPAPHERFRKFGAGALEDISYREPHDISYVRDKFPKMNPKMAAMLGKALTRRRQFFRYRQAHHEKLAAGLEESSVLEHTANEEDDAQTELFPKTHASTLPEHIKNLTDLDLRNDVIDEDNRSDTAASLTSYATSTGFIADVEDRANMVPAPPLRVPPLPKGAEVGNFECAFCYRIVSASTRAAWKRHVFGDLRPYTCLFEDCLDSNADFDRRSRWRAHVSQHHWKFWTCPFQCDGTRYASASDLKAHLSHRHIPNALADQLEAVVAVCEGHTSDDKTVECPFCRHPVIGLRQYTKHVGRHLEQLALFALPDLVGDSGDSDKEDETNSAASGTDADGGRAVGQIPAPEDGESSAMAAPQNQAVGQDGLNRPGTDAVASGRRPMLRLVPLNGSFEQKTITVPFYPETLCLGRTPKFTTVPNMLPKTSNGYFSNTRVSRKHAEIWADANGRFWIRDTKSSNGTFLNGTRLSRENQISPPYELQDLDHLELGLDIVSEDQKTLIEHKVAAKVELAGFITSTPLFDTDPGDSAWPTPRLNLPSLAPEPLVISANSRSEEEIEGSHQPKEKEREDGLRRKHTSDEHAKLYEDLEKLTRVSRVEEERRHAERAEDEEEYQEAKAELERVIKAEEQAKWDTTEMKENLDGLRRFHVQNELVEEERVRSDPELMSLVEEVAEKVRIGKEKEAAEAVAAYKAKLPERIRKKAAEAAENKKKRRVEY